MRLPVVIGTVLTLLLGALGFWATSLSAQRVRINGAAMLGTTGSVSGALTAGICNTGTAMVAGATTAMVAVTSPVTYPGDAADWRAYVSSAGVVTVKECGLGVITPSATVFNVRVLP